MSETSTSMTNTLDLDTMIDNVAMIFTNVTNQLAAKRAERDEINNQIRKLVAQQADANRALKALQGRSKHNDT